MNQNKNQNKPHVPVLLKEVLEYLSPKRGESYLDLTAGYGGHAGNILAITKVPRKAVLVDRDKEAVDYLNEHLNKGSEIIHADFLSAARQLLENKRQFDLILADLGISSPHLDKASRGFSFRAEGPLDMRMDAAQSLTASVVVNNWSEGDLVQIIREYGEEPRAAAVAKAIVLSRPINSTTQLAAVVAKSIRRKQGKIHPATTVFQAIRIAVNNELELLSAALPLWVDLLAPGGRIAVISFHSLEDRQVKQEFAAQAEGNYSATLKLLTKRPVLASAPELVLNPRARSAKLRAAVKIKNKGRG